LSRDATPQPRGMSGLRDERRCYRTPMPSPRRAAALALSLAASTVACTSYKLAAPHHESPRAETLAPAQLAKVCVVRTSAMAMAVTFPTRDNGVLVGATRGPTYFCYHAEPGDHRITIEADELENAVLHAEAGHTYVLSQEVDNVFGYVKCRAVWVDAQEATPLFAQSEHAVLVGVPGSERLPGHTPVAPARAPTTTAGSR
jgi:hypothetical protein